MKYFKREENVTDELTSLYESRGYSRYKPSCFEEYALYQENKDFLIGKNVITFSSLGGKLMAMRPDVTLSLIRHTETPSGSTEKFYYNEKVYRQAAGCNDFKEINQTGVEIIGDIDKVCEVEITALICDTLSAVSKSYILDISHMGFTEGLLSAFGRRAEEIFDYLKRKDLHDFYKLAKSENFDEKLVNAFASAVKIDGNAETALKTAKSIVLNETMENAVDELTEICTYLKKQGYGEKININFSIANNADYYNGVIFNGYIDGVPHRVLSGGRYDKLLGKMGKNGGAIGFALYLGEIERYFKNDQSSVDFLIIYDSDLQEKALDKAFEIIKEGKSVRLARKIPVGLKYKQAVKFTGGEAKSD